MKFSGAMSPPSPGYAWFFTVAASEYILPAANGRCLPPPIAIIVEVASSGEVFSRDVESVAGLRLVITVVALSRKVLRCERMLPTGHVLVKLLRTSFVTRSSESPCGAPPCFAKFCQK